MVPGRNQKDRGHVHITAVLLELDADSAMTDRGQQLKDPGRARVMVG